MTKRTSDWTLAGTNLASIAIRVYRTQAMVSFYSEAFGLFFREVETGSVRSQFADMGSVTLKFVPIRQEIDFEGHPVHQMGFTVEDLERTMSLAVKYGGAVGDEPIRQKGHRHASIRDPDGNTIELYSVD
jgi:predicted enzyme related to lactoylglutathione lyase